MNTIQRITKNIGVLLISQIFSYVLGFITLMYSARYLGVNGYGILSLAIAFTGIFSVLMDLGLTKLTIREVARNKSLANNYIANITLIKIILCIITFITIFLIVDFLGYNQETSYTIYFITFYTILSSFSQLFYAIFQANEKMEYYSFGIILSSGLILTGILFAIYNKFNIIQFSSVYSIVGIMILSYAILIFSWKFSTSKCHFNKHLWINLIKESWPFAVTGISLNVYMWIDTLILSLIQGTNAVGIYSASFNLVMTLLVIPIVFNNALFPLMSRYYISSKKFLNLTFEKLLKIMLVVALPLGIGTVLTANQVITLIYGNAFSDSILTLQILIWSIVIIFIRSPFERLLESSNQQLVLTKIFIISAIFNTILNIIIIPKYSYLGAAVVNVLTDMLVLGIILFLNKNRINIIPILKNMKSSLVKIIISSLIMGLFLYSLKELNLALLIIIGIITYTILLLLFKILSEDEISMLKSILNHEN